ncbi:hypothetical protein ACFQ0B_46400 [Nonomuraea thailandensis]
MAWNRLGAALLGDLAALPPQHRNYVRMLFLDPHVRALQDDWSARAREAVSSLRMAAGTFDLDWQALANVEDHEQIIALITTHPDSPDHAAIRRLASWASKQGLQPSHSAGC